MVRAGIVVGVVVGIVVGVDVGLGDTVLGGNGPGPSGSTTVVGAVPGGDPGLVGGVGSVGLGSVEDSVVVVVVVVGVVYLGRSWTFVRGTQVYSGSGMKPGGTT
jgi:hypothetical protein